MAANRAEDVGQHQLLMLLLVIDAELDQLGDGVVSFIDEALREQPRQRLVDVGAIVAHLAPPTAASAARAGPRGCRSPLLS